MQHINIRCCRFAEVCEIPYATVVAPAAAVVAPTTTLPSRPPPLLLLYSTKPLPAPTQQHRYRCNHGRGPCSNCRTGQLSTACMAAAVLPATAYESSVYSNPWCHIAGSLAALWPLPAASAAASILPSTAELSTAQHGALEQGIEHLWCRRQAAVSKERIKAVQAGVQRAAAV